MVLVHLYCTGVKVSSIYIVLIWFMPFNCETENVCLNISLVQVATPCFKLSVHFQFFQECPHSCIQGSYPSLNQKFCWRKWVTCQISSTIIWILLMCKYAMSAQNVKVSKTASWIILQRQQTLKNDMMFASTEEVQEGLHRSESHQMCGNCQEWRRGHPLPEQIPLSGTNTLPHSHLQPERPLSLYAYCRVNE